MKIGDVEYLQINTYEREAKAKCNFNNFLILQKYDSICKLPLSGMKFYDDDFS